MEFCTQIFHNRGHKMCLYAKSLGRVKILTYGAGFVLELPVLCCVQR